MNIPPTIRTIALSLLSGILLAAAYRIPGAWPLSFVALIPLLIAILSAPSRRAAFSAGAIAGVVSIGAASIWFFDVLPLPEAFGIYSLPAGIAFVTISWAAVVGALGAVLGLWALLVFMLRRFRFIDAVAIAGLFVLCEYLRMIAFNVVTFNPDTINPLFFSAGFIGYPLADNSSWLQAASLGGIAALSFLAVLVNVLLLFFARFPRKNYRIAGVCAVTVLVTTVSLLPIADVRARGDGPPKAQIAVAALSLHAPIIGLGDNFKPFEQQIRELIRDSERRGADLVVLPEDSRLLRPFSSLEHSSVAEGSNISIVDSGIFPLPDNGAHSIRAFSHTSTTTAVVKDKRILTPQGEYLPSLFKLILRGAGARDQLERFLQARNLAVGREMGDPVSIAGARGSVLFCLEVMKPGFAGGLVEAQQSDFLIVMASHAWFEKSDTLARDVLRFTQVQAVDAGVPVVSSANFRSAYLLDKYGRMTVSSGGNGIAGAAVGTISIW